MKKMSFAALGLAGALLLAAPAQAHFMMAYTPQTALEKAADLDFRIVFTHPAEAGHMMDMGGVKEFYALHQRGDGEAKKIDFKPLLKEITWKNPDSSAPAPGPGRRGGPARRGFCPQRHFRLLRQW